MDRWCVRQRTARREVLDVDRLWALLTAWYADRLSPAYRGWTAAEAQAILAGLGLTSRSWRSSGDPHASQK